MKALISIVLAAVLAAGCAAPAQAPAIVRYPQFNYAPTEPKAVVIYANPPSVDYEVIGEVRTRVAADVPMDRLEASLKEEAAKIGARGIVIVVRDVMSERKIRAPAAGAQPMGTAVTPGGGGVVPTQAGRTEEITIPVHEKEITGLVIRLKK